MPTPMRAHSSDLRQQALFGTLNLGMSPQGFTTRHWQRKPLLVRQAFSGSTLQARFGQAPDLLQLARSDGIESRLIQHGSRGWKVTHGPLERIPSLRTARWTVLLQGLDLVWPQARDLLEAFRFLPDARLDDVMVSVAGPQGGVGAHLDSYDVFLVQVSGERHWSIAPPSPDHRFQTGAPLKLLADFRATEQWTLLPGDMLYLPPGWAHNGVAGQVGGWGPCMTASIGFRAPSRHEFLSYALQRWADNLPGPDQRFSDPGREATANPAQIPADLATALEDWMTRLKADQRTARQLIGEFLSEPKPVVWFESRPLLAPGQWLKAIHRQGIRLDPQCRVLYSGDKLFINGETLPLKVNRTIRQLADQRFLAAAECARLDDSMPIVGALRQWHGLGWLHIGATIEGLS
jgi:50S ribosomal protein L16 3-hydroxylase